MKCKLFFWLLMLCAESAFAQVSRPQPGSEEYEKLVMLQTHYWRQYNNGDVKGAAKTLREMSALAPADPNIHMLRSTLFVQPSNYFPDTAIAEISKAIAIDSTVPDFYFERAQLVWFLPGKDSHAKAAADYHKAVYVDSFYYPAINKLWIYYLGINQTQKSAQLRRLGLRKMKESISNDSLSAVKWYWLAEAWNDYLTNLSKPQKYDTVIYCYSRAIALDSTNCVYYFQRSHNYDCKTNCEKRINDLEKAISLCPSPMYYTSLAATYDQFMKNPAKALQVLEQGLLLFPGESQMTNYRNSIKKSNPGIK